ncbi:alpha-ketoglutarate-dependent dioxygenase AlkB family protein [Thalassotalea sp. ND16A]|uniref:alpha-ketoglutarate-dependent dioxygenase AlkB family protein n=1 Tax=Thalassotalea sp. ND16A TaxID=1535422 RepID=UPI00051CC40E|nr:alpha-ketoglutarate-dependent dioxygenase AlkB [Thalassotalea sp. ND16A]KGJ90231.1 hypothetical protein ND16A_1961 [Thalassotalea sp. ND16A]
MSVIGDAVAQQYCAGELLYWPGFYPQLLADSYYQRCVNELNWSQEQIKMFGRRVNIPRLQAWYGDEDAYYTYSGLPLQPQPWQNTLLALKADCEHKLGCHFNSVLANYYRNNNDSMGWHSDNEKQLGEQPLIASLSFGQVRRFCLQHKKSGEKVELNLQSGSLLVMQGDLQSNWQHSLPKSKKNLLGRVNLTFRQIIN